MRGRSPSGPEYVQTLEGSPAAKRRLQTILEVVGHGCRVLEACQRLDISAPRFHQLRLEALQGALASLEARPAGRPSRTESAEAERIHALEQEVQTLQIELRAAQTRAEIALALPPRTTETEKKTTRKQPAAFSKTRRHPRKNT